MKDQPVHVSIGFLGNIRYDTRTHNLVRSLKSRGLRVIFNGFDGSSSEIPASSDPDIRIRRLVRGKIALFFYLRFAYCLTRDLLRQKVGIYFASDFYALPSCFLAARLKGAKVFYDSRELFTELTGIKSRKIVFFFVRAIEGALIRRTDRVITTGRMDSDFLCHLYGISRLVELRNLPVFRKPEKPADHSSRFPAGANGFIMVYQGLLTRGRGIGLSLEVLSKRKKDGLVLLGWGDGESEYQLSARRLGVEERVFFAGKMPQETLINHTAGGDVGLCLIENISVSYYYALPNKLFEYVMAGLPVIVSDLPQMRAVVEKYNIGAIVPDGNADTVVRVLDRWEKEPAVFAGLKENCLAAAKTLNWETEFEKVSACFDI